ncbi:alpha/beta-hydrolase [Coprinellus micaceus]|uniref:Alpha/beta-hydrolase n=1 Tax=Coprinellus micaceus TaxID=71717 RepID=A0A4Y7S5C2_COPMI|nr:alpha/beta-hydrolase [Coprinellus micaceus]
MPSSQAPPLVIASKSVTLGDGTSVFVQAAGDSRRPTLVFVHGFALSALVWNDIMQDESLLQNFHLVAYDMRGSGRSGKPDTLEEYSSLRFAQDFDAVMKAFNVSSPSILVGWYTQEPRRCGVSRLGPESLAGIVYVAALPWLSAGAAVSTEWSAKQGPGFLATDNPSLAVTTRMEFATNLFSLPEKVPAEVLWSWFGTTFLQEPGKLMFLLGRDQDTTNLFEAGRKGLPVLVINGEPSKDKHTNVVESARVIKEHFKNTKQWKVDGASHALFYEEKEEFVKQLLDFAMSAFNLKAI